MGIWGSVIGGGLSAIGSIVGGISASKAMKKVKGNLEDQREKNQNWYDRRYNEVATERADAQAVLTNLEEQIKNRNRQAAGTAAVMGGTEESVAATKAANARAMADAASQIAVAGAQRKDAIEAQYQAKDEALQHELNNMEIGKANQIGNAVQGVASVGSSIAGNF